MTWHIKERTRVEVSVPVIQERKEGGAKGGRKSGKKEADNSISILFILSTRYLQGIIYVRVTIPIIQR